MLILYLDAFNDLKSTPDEQQNEENESPSPREIPVDEFEKGIKKNFLSGVRKAGKLFLFLKITYGYR
jgi:predicted AAA+ superfamily ATPase